MNRDVFPFENLIAWKKAKSFYHKIRDITKTFPSDEKYDLVSQMNRASHSIVSNIAEGSGRSSGKDQARFYTMSYSSLLEVGSDLILVYDRKYIDNEKLEELKIDSFELIRILSGLRSSIK